MEPGIEATACACELLYVYIYSHASQSKLLWVFISPQIFIIIILGLQTSTVLQKCRG